MRYNGTTVPTGRDNIYESSEVHRKSSIEYMDSAFNEDQKEVIESILMTLNSESSSVADLNASLLLLDGRITALEPADNSGADNEVV